MEWKAVTYESGDGVALINEPAPPQQCLDRPDGLRVPDGDAAGRAGRAGRRHRRDGAGRHFCVGADTRALDRFADTGEYESDVRDPLPEPGDPEHPAFGTVFGFPLAVAKPMIAAVNGAVAGVGLVLACFTDVRFGAAGAKWTPSMSKLGLPAEHGISWILPRIIGYARATEWLFSSRVILSEEAQAMGLVHTVHSPEEVLAAALAYARTLVDGAAPSSLRTIKRQLSLDLFRPLAESAHESDRLIPLADVRRQSPPTSERFVCPRVSTYSRWRHPRAGALVVKDGDELASALLAGGFVDARPWMSSMSGRRPRLRVSPVTELIPGLVR